jgi:hypothetical protein
MKNVTTGEGKKERQLPWSVLGPAPDAEKR